MTEQTQEEYTNQVYDYAAELMRNKTPDKQIVANLQEQGLDEESARVVVNNLAVVRAQQKRKAGLKNMLYGGLWCIGGIAVTAITYNAASSGGSYVVAWGAMVIGGIQCLGGIIQAGAASIEMKMKAAA